MNARASWMNKRMRRAAGAVFVVALAAAVLANLDVAKCDCAARCVYTEALVIDSKTYELIPPAMEPFDHCFRIFITDQTDEPPLVDETATQTWKYQRHNVPGAVTCEDNSGIFGTGLQGEGGLVGPEMNITCASECDTTPE